MFTTDFGFIFKSQCAIHNALLQSKKKEKKIFLLKKRNMESLFSDIFVNCFF